jgi:predicted MFS family arabinose efflux permease
MYVVGSDLFIISPLLPYIAADLNLGSEKSGLLVSIFAIAYALASPLFAFVSDKYGRKQMIIFGLFIFSIANLFTAYSTNFISMFLSRLLAGISASAIGPSVYAITGSQAPVDKRGRWLSIAGFGLLSALWSSAPLGAFIVNVISWNKVFLVLGIASAVLIGFNYMVWPWAAKISKKTIYHTQNVIQTLIAVCPTVMWGASLYGLYTYLGFGLSVEIALPAKMSAICFASWGVAAVVGNYCGGWLADRSGAGKAATNSLAVMTLAMLILFLSLKHQYAIWMVLALLSFAAYPFYPAQQSRLTQASLEHSSTLIAWNSSALYLGITLGSALFGVIINHWTFSVLPLFAAAIGGFGALLSLKPFVISNLAKKND